MDFLLNRVVKEKLLPDESDDDEAKEEAEGSVDSYGRGDWSI